MKIAVGNQCSTLRALPIIFGNLFAVNTAPVIDYNTDKINHTCYKAQQIYEPFFNVTRTVEWLGRSIPCFPNAHYQNSDINSKRH